MVEEKSLELRLTTWDRMTLTGVCNGMENSSLSMLRMGLKFIDAMELSEEEREAVGFKDVGMTGGGEWKLAGYEFTITLAGDVLRYFNSTIKKELKVRRWPQSTAVLILDMYERLDITQEG